MYFLYKWDTTINILAFVEILAIHFDPFFLENEGFKF